MDKELEEYLTRKMIIDKHAAETFVWAEEKYKKKIGWDKMKWWKQFMVDWELSKYGSDRFQELKKIQSDYIDDLVKARTTLITSNKSEDKK